MQKLTGANFKRLLGRVFTSKLVYLATDVGVTQTQTHKWVENSAQILSSSLKLVELFDVLILAILA
jgi:hypothetical protein